MNITTAIREAQKSIYVSPLCGQYQVIRPFNGLASVDKATTASNSMSYWTAREHCRTIRISEVVKAVTGNSEFADMVYYECEQARRDNGEDWRKVARKAISEYKN